MPIVKTLETNGLHLSPIGNFVSITSMITMLRSSLSLSVVPLAGVRGIAAVNASYQGQESTEPNTKSVLNFSLKAAEAQPLIGIYNEKIPENGGVRLKHARLSCLL